jgi:crossover junction endodeoxyribonuclease RuvC
MHVYGTTILSLDLGVKTGWSLSKNSVITSGTEFFKEGKTSNGGLKFILFSKFLSRFEEFEIDDVYYEEVKRHAGTYAAHVYGGFQSHLMAWCLHKNVNLHGVGVKTIKKFITGNGNADKQMVINSVISNGFSPKDDNEADSIALLLYAMRGID